MKRWGLIVAVAAVGMVASSQAHATWTVIKWKTTNMCQVWDNAGPKPMTADFKAMSRAHKTFAGAEARRVKLVAKKKCP